MDRLRARFREVWTADTEYRAVDGEVPAVHCACFRELFSGREIRHWTAAPEGNLDPPFRFDDPAILYVAYAANAEMMAHLALGWELPQHVLDLYAEFCLLANGRPIRVGADKKVRSLLAAMLNFNVQGAMDAAEKDEWRQVAIRGGPFSDAERVGLLEYCLMDVRCTERLLQKMLPRIDLERALLRGRYQQAVARMEVAGVPIDVDLYQRFQKHWDEIKAELIRQIDPQYGVFIPRTSLLRSKTKWGLQAKSFAESRGLDPHLFAHVVSERWRARSEGLREYVRAVEFARLRTGLTVNRCQKWEDAGHDYSSWPNFDVVSRELAAEFPELSIGRGYSTDFGFDDVDHAGNLWDILRRPTPTLLKRDDEEIFEEAANLVAEAPDDFLYTESQFSFSLEHFARYIERQGIEWPLTKTGQPVRDKDLMKSMAAVYPQLQGLHDLLTLNEQLDALTWPIGADGRNRYVTMPFGTKTGRNAPPAKKFCFGPARWLRRLIKPGPGRCLLYADWEQQEFGIAGQLSGDQAMLAAYSSRDPYLEFARQAGAVPANATKETHPRERDLYKQCTLAVQYGQSAFGLARRIKQPVSVAKRLLLQHRRTYAVFWNWVENVVEFARLFGWLHTPFGWRYYVGDSRNPRTLLNWLMQSTGADCMRLAAIFLTEAGVMVNCPVHDAFLCECAEADVKQTKTLIRDCMRQASNIVLDGFELNVGFNEIHYPDRYRDDKDTTDTWDRVVEILRRIEERDTPVAVVDDDF